MHQVKLLTIEDSTPELEPINKQLLSNFGFVNEQSLISEQGEWGVVVVAEKKLLTTIEDSTLEFEPINSVVSGGERASSLFSWGEGGSGGGEGASSLLRQGISSDKGVSLFSQPGVGGWVLMVVVKEQVLFSDGGGGG